MSDLDWLSGLLEGEGCFGTQTVSGKIYPYVHLAMTDIDVVQRSADIFPISGSLRSYGSRKPLHKPIHVVTWSHRHAVELMWAVLPRMCARRGEKIVEILGDAYESRFQDCRECRASYFVPWGTTLNSKFCSEDCRKVTERRNHNAGNQRYRAKLALVDVMNDDGTR